MSISLTKPPPSGPPGTDPVTSFRNWISTQVFDGYCSSVDCSAMEKAGVASFGLDQKQSTLIVEMELSAHCVANERALLKELDANLDRFTSSSKKLTPKEHEDAIQMVCRARTGYRKGLEHQAAEQYVTAYCRRNRVKVKKGILSWEIP